MFKNIVLPLLMLTGFYMPGRCAISMVSPEKLNALLAQKPAPTVVDVRSGYDFQKGHIPGAVNAAYNTIDKAALPKAGTLALYCGNDKCPLSHLAAKTLETLGYKDLSVLEGGITAWIAKGFAVETATGLQQKKTDVKIISILPDELRKRLAEKTTGIIDVRPAKEFKIAHIQGAKNIPLEALGSSVAALSKDLEWIIYDAQNERVKTAAQLLAQKEFKVMELSGGIQVWAAKKYPVEIGQ